MQLNPDSVVELTCLVSGIGISGLISFAKQWSVIKDHPKIVAMVLSILTTIISGLTIGGMDWAAITACTLIPFSAAVATHEVVNEVKKEV